MATFSFADISATMPQLYRELVPNVQRKCPMLRLLPIRQGMGQNVAWDVSFSGQASGAVNADGGSFLTATSDATTAASLAWASYSAPVKVTSKALWTGASTPGDYAFLQRLIDRNVMEAVQAMLKLINQHIFSGTGSSNQITGLSTAVLTSGTYANILASTYADWAASLGANNSGTPAAITLANIKSAASTIAADASNSFGRPDLVIAPPAVFNTIESLFDTFARTVYDPKTAQLILPNQERVTMNPNVISTPGGQILRTGFRAMYWESAGLWIIEDPDCTHTAQTNPTNTVYFLNSGAIDIEFLPPASVSPYMQDQKIMAAVEQDLGPLANLQFELRPRGRTSFAEELDVLCMLQLRVKSRAAHGFRTDVS